MYTEPNCAARWAAIQAPRTLDVRTELLSELAEYLGATVEQVEIQLDDAATRFAEEWRQLVSNPRSEKDIIAFYNSSKTEIFDLVQWHISDSIHFRSLICLDVAQQQPGSRRCLDYGSGIGSDALVFAEAGYAVTLADISEPLLAFAKWRCERRGHTVEIVDLKRRSLPKRAYDVAICFDVLEHIPRPLRSLLGIGRALVPGGLLFLHAPFGVDPLRPMHVVHRDEISTRMRTVGFNWREDLERSFPRWLFSPRVYQAFDPGLLDRVGYYLYDVWMPGPTGARLAALYRQIVRRRPLPMPVGGGAPPCRRSAG